VFVDVDGIRFGARNGRDRQLRDLETLREALSTYAQLTPRHMGIFMRNYARMRGGGLRAAER
jgi:hypothetical protein